MSDLPFGPSWFFFFLLFPSLLSRMEGRVPGSFHAAAEACPISRSAIKRALNCRSSTSSSYSCTYIPARYLFIERRVSKRRAKKKYRNKKQREASTLRVYDSKTTIARNRERTSSNQLLYSFSICFFASYNNVFQICGSYQQSTLRSSFKKKKKGQTRKNCLRMRAARILGERKWGRKILKLSWRKPTSCHSCMLIQNKRPRSFFSTVSFLLSYRLAALTDDTQLSGSPLQRRAAAAGPCCYHKVKKVLALLPHSFSCFFFLLLQEGI